MKELDIMKLLAEAESNPEYPKQHYDENGDIFEILLTGESYHAEKQSDFITVYRGYDSGEVVGVLIENVTAIIGDRNNKWM